MPPLHSVLLSFRSFLRCCSITALRSRSRLCCDYKHVVIHFGRRIVVRSSPAASVQDCKYRKPNKFACDCVCIFCSVLYQLRFYYKFKGESTWTDQSRGSPVSLDTWISLYELYVYRAITVITLESWLAESASTATISSYLRFPLERGTNQSAIGIYTLLKKAKYTRQNEPKLNTVSRPTGKGEEREGERTERRHRDLLRPRTIRHFIESICQERKGPGHEKSDLQADPIKVLSRPLPLPCFLLSARGLCSRSSSDTIRFAELEKVTSLPPLLLKYEMNLARHRQLLINPGKTRVRNARNDSIRIPRRTWRLNRR